jgi:glucan phosphoethanolaminetransferase (alkaline phosphatase superfamily)
MRSLLAPLKRISLQLFFLLGCYFISRCIFVCLNSNHFAGLSFFEFLRIAFFALRFDLSSLLALNGFYIILLLLPLPIWRMPQWQKILQIIFIIINALAFSFEISDWAYFPFNFKRSTADVLKLITRKSDFIALLPSYLLNYWYVPFAAVLFVWLFVKVNKKICLFSPLNFYKQKYNLKTFIVQTIILGITAGLSVIGIRGGLQYVPIGIRNAIQVAESKYTPIVLNTPFSIINSYADNALEDVHYFTDNNLRNYINTSKHFTEKQFKPKNVVVIILESFSKEFTGIGGLKSYTPFLDSLMNQSLVCTNAYANALRSAEGIPAILAGIPSLQEEPFTTSLYGTNQITSLPNQLHQEGYSSTFYHGGTNGTMSFDVFTANAGFQKYNGRTEYNNERDYDGNWGIWDEPFLQYVAHDISSNLKEPFCAAMFTLSSHPPYKLPKEYKDHFPKGTLAIHPCVGYTDNALRKFFATAAQQKWYKNTLFIITPDHCSPMSDNNYYQSKQGKYAIPIVFFAPGDATLKGAHKELTQQIDILPSVLDYLGYDKPFFAFGNSIFQQKNNPFVINQGNGDFLWLMNNYLLESSGIQLNGLYDFSKDSMCNQNLLPKEAPLAQQQGQYLKAFIQAYNTALIHNTMWTK